MRKKKLTTKQKEFLSNNMNIVKQFYNKEMKKDYIPDNLKEDFLSSLYYKFCFSGLYYNEEKGRKFSTYAYSGLDFSVNEIRRYIHNKLPIKNISLQKIENIDSDSEDVKRLHYYPTWTYNEGWNNKFIIQWEKLLSFIEKAGLTEEELHIIKLYYVENCTCMEIGKKIGRTKQGVHYKLKRALSKLKLSAKEQNYEIEDFIKG